MLDDCCYDQIKILHDLSKIAFFLKNSCQKDVKKCNHNNCEKSLGALGKEIDALIEKVHKCMK